MELLVASDHAGFELKNALIKAVPEVSWKDLGPSAKDSVDYPDFADRVCKVISRDENARGVLICGSGQGMVMRANRYPAVRAALVYNDEITRLSRQHNNANVLCLGARFATVEQASQWVRIFLQTEFEGGRHSARVAKIDAPMK